ncbi:MAG: hypothetical protein RR752_06455, partial [Mucinivorans sp.]
MADEDFLDTIASAAPWRAVQESTAHTLMLRGVSGSLFSALVALDHLSNRVVLAVMEDRDAASYLYNDLYNLLEKRDAQDRVMLLPTAYKRAISSDREDPSGIVQRTAVLTALAGEALKRQKATS